MGGGFGSISGLGMSPEEGAARQDTQVTPGLGYGGKGSEALGIFGAVLGGLRRGRLAKVEQEYGTIERQYRIARSNYDALQDKLKANPSDPYLRQAVDQAHTNMETAYNDLINFGVKSSKKGKSQDGTMQRLGGFLQRLMVGPQPNVPYYPPPLPGGSSVKPGDTGTINGQRVTVRSVTPDGHIVYDPIIEEAVGPPTSTPPFMPRTGAP